MKTYMEALQNKMHRTIQFFCLMKAVLKVFRKISTRDTAYILEIIDYAYKTSSVISCLYFSHNAFGWLQGSGK